MIPKFCARDFNYWTRMNTDLQDMKNKDLTESIIKIFYKVNYLKATDIEVGLLLNFGPKPEIKRKVFDNEGK
jgi:hypothetical protein